MDLSPRFPTRSLLVLLVLPALLTGCEEVEQFVDIRRDLTPHEAYVESLVDAGLLETALGREWTTAAHRAVSRPNAVTLPFEEEGYLPPDEPSAVGYRVSLRRGRVLGVQVHVDGGDSLRLFLDLFRVPESPEDPLRPVLTTDTLPSAVTYEPSRSGEFILRVQPELLRGGRYRLVLTEDPVLAFPVEGVDTEAIWSIFGDGRDGGRRLHHGVDIFASRGTPALAASSGEVYRVQDTSRGGKVVWIRDDARNVRLYYAHLDSQLVSEGTRVEPGDTVDWWGTPGTPAPHHPISTSGSTAEAATNAGLSTPCPSSARPGRGQPGWLVTPTWWAGGCASVRRPWSSRAPSRTPRSRPSSRIPSRSGCWPVPAPGTGWRSPPVARAGSRSAPRSRPAGPCAPGSRTSPPSSGPGRTTAHRPWPAWIRGPRSRSSDRTAASPTSRCPGAGEGG